MNNPQAKALAVQANNMLHVVCGIQNLSKADKQRVLQSVQELLQAVSEMPTQEKSVWIAK